MELPSLEEFLQTGAHFGHKKERTHPRAKKFIFGIRDSVNIIDLEKTTVVLKEALDFIKQTISSGKTILLLGTKRQVKDFIKESAEKNSLPYINQRWLGGMLTNFETIRKSIKLLDSLEAEMAGEDYQKLTKKEKLLIERKKDKLLGTLQGIRILNRLPDALFIVDTAKENTAVLEARKMNIPIVGICDTDANPELITYPIPANDDAAKSLGLIMSLLNQAVAEGKNKLPVATKPEAVEPQEASKKIVKKPAKKAAKPAKK